MYIKILATIFLMLLLAVFQISFISGLPGYFANFNLVLVVLIMMQGFSDFKRALIWAIAVGTFLDMYSFSFFGLNIIALVLALFVTHFLLDNVLTNRSLYTFVILTMAASLIYELFIISSSYLLNMAFDYKLSFNLNVHFWTDELLKLIANMFLSFVLFYLITFFSKRFKPMFLIR